MSRALECRASGLQPHAAVLVATVRALKTHGGGPPVVAGRPLAREYAEENLELLAAGCCNLEHHIGCLTGKFGVKTVVAVNRFHTDTDAEIALVKERALAAGAFAAVEANHWARGGAGAAELATSLSDACAAARAEAAAAATPSGSGSGAAGGFRYLYPLDAPIKEKVATIAAEIYGAAAVEYSPLAEEQVRRMYVIIGGANTTI
jgi:formyltetrahydrofolate synthetase